MLSRDAFSRPLHTLHAMAGGCRRLPGKVLVLKTTTFRMLAVFCFYILCPLILLHALMGRTMDSGTHRHCLDWAGSHTKRYLWKKSTGILCPALTEVPVSTHFVC